MNLKIMISIVGFFFLTSCLKTRADLGEQDQSQVYSKKNADNQISSRGAKNSQITAKGQAIIDERDDLIRSLNGRVEGLENQISILQKEKAAAPTGPSAESQKIQLLQDALVKMEAQIQKLESEGAASANSKPPAVYTASGSDANAAKVSPTVKKNSTATGSYESAQEHFEKKEWKKAILSYQKYVDENSKGKNVPDAKYKIGVCFQELGMKEEAMAFYEEVIANFGKTESGKKAKIRLAKVKK